MQKPLVTANTRDRLFVLERFGISSIGSRLFLAVMLPFCIGLAGLGFVLYKNFENDKLLHLKTETDIIVRELDAELRTSESFLKSLVVTTSFLQDSGERSPTSYEKLVLAFMDARPKLITGFGIMQLPQGLVDRQWFGSYIEETQPNRGVTLSNDPKYSLVELWQVDKYPELQYYKDAVKANRYFWSKPYINDVYPIPLMTFSGPIRDRNGKLIAVMNGDINIRDLSNISNSSHSGFIDNEYTALVTEDGTFLSYTPDPTKASKLENIDSIPTLKSVWENIRQEILQGKSQGYLRSDLTKSYWVYQKVPSTDWIMLKSVSYKDVIEPALLISLSATFSAGTILSIVIFLFVRSLNRRLKPILDVCDATLSDEETPIYSNDEINHLSNAFFSMIKRQNSLLEQLKLTNNHLIESNRLKDSFLANMSHELRTPLNAILGLNEGLQEEIFGELNEKQLSVLQTIEGSSNHLLNLINDILDLAKIESEQIKLDYKPTSISRLCETSLTFVSQQAFQKRIQISCVLDDELPELLIDERRILQVLINLLNNAVKFTPEGGNITLEVRHQESNCVLLSITDTGIGISPENIKKLFQPFIQIDGSLNRQYEGTGLGLALAKRIVELHNGKIGLTSTLGVGSCFTIELPYLQKESLPELLSNVSSG
ncbi:sensor histidine kinase [Pseudanabaena sp. ABRG5-3]|uniref:sensor histidine kinase n=1 Tax=Pseudanabaena sp. ABRG5-3 TaxID=685565 RepID=UPI000DC722FB|nr:sensor histidine kinase [Pseudanabaena sp. ABRG5-3]BBC26072.1 multi-sensor hybrid histidine kinase [Pseudanabaena sp. ABRG5-3]